MSNRVGQETADCADQSRVWAGYRPQDCQIAKKVAMDSQRDKETYAIIGAAMRVHGALGFGFLEKVYQDALEVELHLSKIPYEREKAIDILYRGIRLGEHYYADFLCYGDIIVELKALKKLNKLEESQVLHYLRASRLTRALLINFGQPSLQIIRFANGYKQTLDEDELQEIASKSNVSNLAVPSAVAEP